MNRSSSPFLRWTLALATSVMAVGLSARSALRAYARAQAQISTTVDIASLAARIERLRSAASELPTAEQADGPLAPRLSEATAQAGLPGSIILSVTADAAIPVSGEAALQSIRRQRAAVQLGGLTLPQLGKFLALWRERQPGWVVTGIDITPEPAAPSAAAAIAGGGGGEAGTDLTLRVSLVLETVLVDKALGGPS